VAVGKINPAAERLLAVTKECLDASIKKVRPGARLNDIGGSIQKMAERAGYGVVRDFVGHGVGYQAHEDPEIFHYLIDERSSANLELKEGMVICIEPMINAGKKSCKVLKDEWTVVTKDKKLSAQWEHTLLVTETGCEILTLRPEETIERIINHD
jgi:methionyl aminopeptidase